VRASLCHTSCEAWWNLVRSELEQPRAEQRQQAPRRELAREQFVVDGSRERSDALRGGVAPIFRSGEQEGELERAARARACPDCRTYEKVRSPLGVPAGKSRSSFSPSIIAAVMSVSSP
jgi:hypothetical protein